jgi:hypothetical protein
MKAFPSLQVSGVSTIDTVYRAVEKFRDRLEPTIDGAPPLSPLDAFLLNLIVEFSPQPAFVADLACDATSGSSVVVCLANPRAPRVASATSDVPRRLGGAGLRVILDEFTAEHFGPHSHHVHLPMDSFGAAWDVIRTDLSPHQALLVIVDSADLGRSAGCRLDDIFGRFPNGLIVAVNVGKAGECESAQRLVGECRNDSPYRLWLMPEVSSSIPNSRLALIARRDHPSADSLIRRIDHCFTTNFDLLDLVRDSCNYAVEKGIADRLDQEIDRLQEALRRSGEELDQTRREIESLRERLHVEMVRPVSKAMMIQSARRLLTFGRTNRRFLAPANSRREWTLRALMRFQRRLRGQAA